MTEETAALTPEETTFFETGGEAPLEPVETPAAEAATDAPELTPEAPKEPEKPKVVPLEALHEARSINKEMREQIRQLSEQKAAMEKRFAEFMEQGKPQPPAFDENPAENLRHEVTQTKAQLEQMAKATQAAQQEQQFSVWYQAQAAQFSQQTPDFMNAYQTFIGARQQELENAGMAPSQIQAQIKQDEMALAISAAKVGINPAQLIYQAAMAKGYQKAAPAAPAQPVTPNNKLETVAKGIQSSKSLSQVAGKAPENLTLEALANMPDHEFKQYANDDKWAETMSRLTA